jgi:hypothetical protein
MRECWGKADSWSLLDERVPFGDQANHSRERGGGASTNKLSCAIMIVRPGPLQKCREYYDLAVMRNHITFSYVINHYGLVDRNCMRIRNDYRFTKVLYKPRSLPLDINFLTNAN